MLTDEEIWETRHNIDKLPDDHPYKRISPTMVNHKDGVYELTAYEVDDSKEPREVVKITERLDKDGRPEQKQAESEVV